MNPSRFEVITTAAPAARPAPAPRRWNPLAVLAGLALLGLAGTLTWVLEQQRASAAVAVEESALEQAAAALERSVEQDRRHVLALAALLADDTRVRTPLMMPKFDEATVRDVLEDLRKSSGASVVAILDLAGKARVSSSGAAGLRGLELAGSPLAKSALGEPRAEVWTLSQGALVMGVAPVRSAAQTLGLLALGFEIRGDTLAGIAQSLGVAGALLFGGHVVTATAREPALLQAFEAAGALEEGGSHLVRAGAEVRARAGHLGSAAAAGRVVWLIGERRPEGLRDPRLLHALPPVLVALTFLLGLLFTRGKTGAQA